MDILTFGIDDRALLDGDSHSKRWNQRTGAYVNRLDVIVEMKNRRKIYEKHLSENVRIIPIYVPYPFLYSFIAYRKALELHKKDPYNLVTTEEPFRTGFAGWLFKRKTGVPLSVEYHNDTFYNDTWLNERPISHRIYIILGKMALAVADSIRCVNKKHSIELRKLCNNDRGKLIEIIPVPTEFYNYEKHSQKAKEIRREILKSTDGIIILFVGRLVPSKKVDELIKIFAEIRNIYLDTHLVIVGDGLERKKLIKLTEELGNERIIFKGYIPEDEVLSYFGASDIFINPAHIEAYGKEFIEALIRLIEDKELRKSFGNNGCKMVEQKFHYEDSLKKMKDFWKKTIELQKREYKYANK